MKTKTRNTISLILNIAMVIMVVYSIAFFFSKIGQSKGVGNMSVGGFYCFRFFTIDSNVLAATASLLLIPFNIKSIKSNKDELPTNLLLFKFIGTIAVTLTLMVVLLFLGPMNGYPKMFEDVNIYLHLICPLISLISFMFFEKGLTIDSKKVVYGLIPVIIYGTIYAINVLVIKVWEDFYHFNIGGYWYITYLVIILATYLFSLIVSKVHNKYE